MNNKTMFHFAAICATLCLSVSPGSAQTAIAPKGKPVIAATIGKSLALKLSGLHCAGCAMSVQTRLLKVAGVASVVVSPETQTATVTLAKGAKRPTDAALKGAVKSAGYTCVSVKG